MEPKTADTCSFGLKFCSWWLAIVGASLRAVAAVQHPTVPTIGATFGDTFDKV